MAKELLDTNIKKLYELGYLLVPTIAEEQVASEVEKVKNIITRGEGEIVSEDFPKLITLAYTMQHGGSGQKKKFDKAYFGWVKFNAQATGVEFIRRQADAHQNFLRYMIVKTVKDEPQAAPRTHLKTVVAEGPTPTPRLTEEEISKQPIDEAELDKTLERLVV